MKYHHEVIGRYLREIDPQVVALCPSSPRPTRASHI